MFNNVPCPNPASDGPAVWAEARGMFRGLSVSGGTRQAPTPRPFAVVTSAPAASRRHAGKFGFAAAGRDNRLA
jgi:hypothetical protein